MSELFDFGKFQKQKSKVSVPKTESKKEPTQRKPKVEQKPKVESLSPLFSPDIEILYEEDLPMIEDILKLLKGRSIRPGYFNPISNYLYRLANLLSKKETVKFLTEKGYLEETYKNKQYRVKDLGK